MRCGANLYTDFIYAVGLPVAKVLTFGREVMFRCVL